MNKIKIFMVLIVIGIAIIFYGNNAIQVTKYTLKSEKWPQALDGYTIVHLSDLQSKSFGRDQIPLINKIRSQNPDLIVMTGDLIDRHHYAKEPAIQLMKACVDIAPTAFVTGNHEIWHGTTEALKNELTEMGIMVLDNQTTALTKGDASFNITGLADRAAFMEQYDYETAAKRLAEQAVSGFSLLLSHRPEQFDIYWESNYDLVLAGHSHGGQIRLPFLDGLLSPNQGFLPEYDGGLFKKDGTTMIVSRGLGNSAFPIRIMNRPEIPVIVLMNSSPR